MSFWGELKRRNVFKVAVAYVVVAWLVIQVADIVLPTFEAPPWIMQVLIFLLVLGLPVAVVLAWAFELTPEGVRLDSTSDEASHSTRGKSGRTAYILITVALVLSAALYILTDTDSTLESGESLDVLMARPTVLVLPFDFSGDEESAYIADGLTDWVIVGLQRLQRFPVIQRSVSYEFPDSGMTASDYANEHGAEYVLDGRVLNVGSDLSVNATLSRVDRGETVWATATETFAANAEMFEFADRLVANIAAELLESEIERVDRSDRPPIDAWENYIKGLTVVLDFDADEYEEAREYLDTAIRIAPDMAEAWWAIGELEAFNYATKPLSEEEDRQEVEKIIEIFYEAHERSPFHAAQCGCLGILLTAVGQPDQARAIFEQGLEAHPLSPELRIDYARFLLWEGRLPEALTQTDLALQLGLVQRDESLAWGIRSFAALVEGDERGALEAVNRALAIDREAYGMSVAVALLYLLHRRQDAASLLAEAQASFAGVSPEKAAIYVLLKPIDDWLAQQRNRGRADLPATVSEIYTNLRGLSSE